MHGVKDKLFSYDGTRLHYTLPFREEGYSLVYYTSARWAQCAVAEEPVHQRLSEIDFPLPSLARSPTQLETAADGRSRASGSEACHHPIAHPAEDECAPGHDTSSRCSSRELEMRISRSPKAIESIAGLSRL